MRQSRLDEDIQTDTYQATLLHKEFAQSLNVVILVKTNLKTHACSHVILFSSDLTLSYEKIIDYYKLRFQIEFNFRDAKQFWGLEDFMNRGQTAVTNAVNLSFFMVNLSHYLLAQFREDNPGSGIVDLQAYCRGFRYVRESFFQDILSLTKYLLFDSWQHLIDFMLNDSLRSPATDSS